VNKHHRKLELLKKLLRGLWLWNGSRREDVWWQGTRWCHWQWTV